MCVSVSNRRSGIIAARQQNLPHTPDKVADDLNAIKWGPGREMTKAVVEKMVNIWEKVKKFTHVADLILKAQGQFGRDSPFEEYSKLLQILSSSRSDADLAPNDVFLLFFGRCIYVALRILFRCFSYV